MLDLASPGGGGASFPKETNFRETGMGRYWKLHTTSPSTLRQSSGRVYLRTSGRYTRFVSPSTAKRVM